MGAKGRPQVHSPHVLHGPLRPPSSFLLLLLLLLCRSTATMCSKASLQALIGASSGTVKAAYCNDQYLVIISNKAGD